MTAYKTSHETYSTQTFTTQSQWRAWLNKHHETENGVWLKFYKKGSGKEGFNYDQALDEALCYGWIDGISHRLDEEAYLQKFTPRRPRSVWSKINIGHVERLTKAGKMTAAGQAAIDAAKADGRWAAAYDSPANIEVPVDFIAAVKKDPASWEFFEKLGRSYKYIIAIRLFMAKRPETRQRRFDKFLALMKKGEKPR